jgi:predicted DNA-binding transcriptional regulator YafY
MADTAERLLRLLSLLTARRGWRGEDLAGRLGVTPRTVRRDVERLRNLGYEVRAVPGPAGGYELGAGSALPPMLLDDDAAVAVAVGLRAAADGAVAGMAEAAVRAAAIIERLLPDRLRRRADALQSAVVPLPAGAAPVSPDLLGTLALACRDAERLRFAYVDGSGKPSRRHVEPYRLVSTSRRWYLVARDIDRDDWRSFRLDRISQPLPTGQRSSPADPPDAAQFVAEGSPPARIAGRRRCSPPALTASTRSSCTWRNWTSLSSRWNRRSCATAARSCRNCWPPPLRQSPRVGTGETA